MFSFRLGKNRPHAHMSANLLFSARINEAAQPLCRWACDTLNTAGVFSSPVEALGRIGNPRKVPLAGLPTIRTSGTLCITVKTPVVHRAPNARELKASDRGSAQAAGRGIQLFMRESETEFNEQAPGGI